MVPGEELIKKNGEVQGTNLFIKAYVDAYRKKFGGLTPPVRGAYAGCAKRIVDACETHEYASSLAETYLDMNDSWFIYRGYDLFTMEKSLSRIIQKHELNLHISYETALAIEKQSLPKTTSMDIARKKLERELLIKDETGQSFPTISEEQVTALPSGEAENSSGSD
jgi:hypothetical protein